MVKNKVTSRLFSMIRLKKGLGGRFFGIVGKEVLRNIGSKKSSMFTNNVLVDWAGGLVQHREIRVINRPRASHRLLPRCVVFAHWKLASHFQTASQNATENFQENPSKKWRMKISTYPGESYITDDQRVYPSTPANGHTPIFTRPRFLATRGNFQTGQRYSGLLTSKFKFS